MDTVLYYKVFDHWMNLFMEIVWEKFEGKWNIPTTVLLSKASGN